MRTVIPRLAALPTAGVIGRVVMLTTDGHLYTWDGAAWVDTGGGGGGGGGAPTTATYVTLTADATLTNERTLAGEFGVVSITDGGAGNAVTVGLTAAGVALSKIANISAARILGRVTAGAGVTQELTGTQATTLLDVFTSALKGLVPASGGGTTNFLRADGSWAAPGGGGGSPDLDGGDAFSIYGGTSPIDGGTA